MAVYSERFDVRDADLDTQIESAESGLSATSIEARRVVGEGQNHVRVVWFYTA